MKFFYLFIFCSLFIHFSQAQSSFPLIPSDSLIKKAIVMMDNERLQESMELLAQVSELSPEYPKAQYEYAYAAYKNEEYSKALKALDNVPENSNMRDQFVFHQVRANLYDELQDTIQAKKAYEYLIDHFPYKSSGYFDYALFLLDNKELKKAAKNLQKSLYLNPAQYKSHYLLGIMAIENGYYSEGIISCITALYLYPENSFNSNALVNLNKFLVTIDPNIVKLDLHDGKDNPFVDIEKLLKSEFALSNDYDNETKFTDKFMNQIHLFWYSFDKVKETGSFYNEFYVPFWKEVKKDLDFNTLACILHYNLDSKSIQREVKKESKNINKSYEYLTKRYKNKLYYRSKDLKGEKRAVYHNLENGELMGVGPYNGENIHGEWNYIYPAHGVHYSLVNYDEEGKAQGDVEFYNLDGTIDKKTTFKDDEIEGWEIYYDKKGNEVSRFFYKNGKLENEAVTKYPNGNIKCSKHFKEDKLNGTYICNYPDGTKRIELNFIDDAANGSKKYYNSTGTLIEELELKDDEINGISKGYYDDGSLAYIEKSKDGKLVDEQKYYFPDGKVRNLVIYSKDGKIQSSKNYNMLGNLVELNLYNSKGEYHGENIQYFYNGDKNIITTYKNGVIKKHQVFDYKGDIVQDVKIQNKDLNTYLNILGDPIAKGKKIRNKLQGKWTYYYPNGSLKRTTNYDKNSNNHGEFTDYHVNGKISSKTNYIDDKAQGLYEDFYSDGTLKTEGVYFNNLPIGEWRFYLADKSLFKKTFYNNQGQIIKQQVLNKKGIPFLTYFYENDKIVKMVTHSKNDKVYDFANMLENNTITISESGELYDVQIKNGLRHGKDRSYDSAGHTIVEGVYQNGEKNGEERKYNALGNLASQANYIAGKEWGTRKSFNYLGILTSTREFKDGKPYGKFMGYYLNGNKRLEYMTQGNQTLSTIDYFGSNGELLFSKHEQDNYFYGYTLADKSFQVASKGKAQIVAYYKNGNKGLEIDYESGEIHGKYNFYYENGKPYIISSREYGIYQGDYTVYYPNGQVFYKENYELGALQGPVVVFNENGDKLAELNYHYNYLDGEVKIYENKQLKYTKIYDLEHILQTKIH